MVLLMAGAATWVPCQELPAPRTLMEAQQDIDYADLLNAAQLTAEQLDALLKAQGTIQAETVLGPDEATALAEVRQGILRGLSREQAMGALGERGQAVGQAQMRLQQLLQASSKQLSDLLTEEQKSAIAWAGTPARALEGVLENVGNARKAPDAQWQQFRTQMVQGISQLSSQVDPAGKASPEQIGALLDAAHGMDDATFEAKRATLPREWAQTTMPTIVGRLSNPQFREQQVGMVMQRLLTYERGSLLVQAKQDALVAR
jgi:peptidoglycan hydrolase-like protein with peptidoglycan-binding domain